MQKVEYLIVYNPCSGKKGQRYLRELTGTLQGKEKSFDIYHTKAESMQTENELSAIINNYQQVVSIGGDGTLHLLSNLLAYTNIPLGIIPAGTGNDFSKCIYNENNDVIDVVTAEYNTSLDLGYCNGRYFINVLGIGYDALVVKNTRKKSLLRGISYTWSALKYLPLYREEKLHITADCLEKNEAAFMVTFANGKYFGNGMKIAPNANMADGLLDCCWIGKSSFITRCRSLIKIFSGAHLSENTVEYVKGSEFTVHTGKHAIEADGEFAGYTPANICVKKNALRLKVPAHYKPE